MPSAIHEELQALRRLAKEFNEREEFQQKYPNLPVPKIARWAGSLPQNPPEDDWKVIRNIAVERYMP
jgi:hypothetical protein